MSRRKVFFRAAALLLLPSLAACGSASLFRTYDLPESPSVAEAPWPRLIDTPAALPAGEYGAGIPDPTQGAAVSADLGQIARDASAKAAALSAPVLTDAERRRLTRGR
jgi:hypothetical protein